MVEEEKGNNRKVKYEANTKLVMKTYQRRNKLNKDKDKGQN